MNVASERERETVTASKCVSNYAQKPTHARAYTALTRPSSMHAFSGAWRTWENGKQLVRLPSERAREEGESE